MTYEKPKIMDLSVQTDKAQGNGDMCFNGSGHAEYCRVGYTAALKCYVGSTAQEQGVE